MLVAERRASSLSFLESLPQRCVPRCQFSFPICGRVRFAGRHLRAAENLLQSHQHRLRLLPDSGFRRARQTSHQHDNHIPKRIYIYGAASSTSISVKNVPCVVSSAIQSRCR